MPSVCTPEWVKTAVFYQIFPDRFAKSHRVNKAAYTLLPWDSEPPENGYMGGNLYGVIEKLDYLQSLGITALYMCPIFSSTTNHRYNTHDYFQVDPMLGGNEALHELIAALKARGMRIVLDGVFNHVAPSFLPFADVMENQSQSAYADWFKIMDYPVNAYDHSVKPTYWAWWNLHHMPTLNHDNPEVRDYIYRVAEYWLQQGIDGWRLDVPFEIKSKGFWQGFRQRVKAVNPDAYIVGEVWGEAKQWLKGDQFDAVMNYLFNEAAIPFVAQGKLDAAALKNRDKSMLQPLSGKAFSQKMQQLQQLYAPEINAVQLNLLDSHDAARIITVFNDDAEAVKLAWLLMFTFPGAPCIYYGDEIGLDGSLPERFARKTMPWSDMANWNQDLFQYLKRLIALRKQHDELATGAFRVLHADEFSYVYLRCSQQRRFLVAVNVGVDPISLHLEDLGCANAEVLFGSLQCETQQLTIPARQGGVLGL